jgi:hypothetical protein
MLNIAAVSAKLTALGSLPDQVADRLPFVPFIMDVFRTCDIDFADVHLYDLLQLFCVSSVFMWHSFAIGLRPVFQLFQDFSRLPPATHRVVFNIIQKILETEQTPFNARQFLRLALFPSVERRRS